MSRRPLVIGIGNEHRADDAAGLAVARTLRARALRGVAVAEASGEMMALMQAWRHAETVILVDAVTSGAPPGTVHRLDAQAESIPDAYFPCSTHAFGVAEAIALARALDQLPPHLIVYGIEGQSFRATVGLSPPVAKGVALAAEHVVHELRNMRHRRHRRGDPDPHRPGVIS